MRVSYLLYAYRIRYVRYAQRHTTSTGHTSFDRRMSIVTSAFSSVSQQHGRISSCCCGCLCVGSSGGEAAEGAQPPAVKPAIPPHELLLTSPPTPSPNNWVRGRSCWWFRWLFPVGCSVHIHVLCSSCRILWVLKRSMNKTCIRCPLPGTKQALYDVVPESRQLCIRFGELSTKISNGHTHLR